MTDRSLPVDLEHVESWRTALAEAGQDAFPRIVVLERVDSTQDEIRRIGAVPGTVVAALRQMRGRGQLGRTWEDTTDAGVALTAAMPRASSARLMLVGAIAALGAMRAFVDESQVRLQLKWPNDVIVGQRKLAGVLVETTGDCALVGIGVNVRQRSFPPPLDRTATSLAMLGIEPPRCLVAGGIVARLRELQQLDDSALVETYRIHDSLRGTRRSFMHAGEQYDGVVLDVDPLSAIVLRKDDGEVVSLPPATTSLAR
jgi:BirA family biotin operon repressor/biotin-[acetyl-CoA-carboxylase] ligase